MPCIGQMNGNEISLKTRNVFLAHLSWKPKWAFLIVRRPSVGIHVCSNDGPHSFPRWENHEIAKLHWLNLKTFFSKTTRAISTKRGTKHHWVVGIQIFQMKGHILFQGEIILKNSKINWRNGKIFFSRSTGPISTKLDTKHPLVLGIHISSNEETHPFPWEIITKKRKYTDEI